MRGTDYDRPVRVVPRRATAGAEGIPPRLVVATGAVMIGAQLIFRAWALYPSWFYTDDYRLLFDARSRGLSWSYLWSSFDSQLMPFGRLVAWLVAEAGPLNWPLAATLTLVGQAAAGAACLWMLCGVFGTRPAVLPLLGVYLTSAMTMPALMWWAASLNQVPLQVVFFSAVAMGVRHLRSRRTLWLLGTVLAVGAGLLCYVKVLLVIPVLGFLALAYFGSGSPTERTRTVLRSHRGAAAALVLAGGVYAVYYVTQVPQPFHGARTSVAGPLANSMVGTSFAAGVWGGPWRWSLVNPPVGYADPPPWTVHVAWSLMLLVALYGFLTRYRTLRAWLLLAGYLAMLYLLVVTTRAPIAGEIIGLEYRYLTDIACVLTLCLGLVFLPVPGSVESSAPRETPRLTLRIGTLAIGSLTALVCVSGLVSSAAYARIWHSDNPGHHFVQNARGDLRRVSRVDLADRVVPATVIPGFSYPYNTTRRLVPLIDDRVRFPRVTSRLAVLADDGTLHPALIRNEATGLEGTVADCGWKVGGEGALIPLDQGTQGFQSWVRIGYLSSADSPVTVTLGTDTVDTEVRRGPRSLFIHTDQAFDTVSVRGLSSGTTLCVDTVEVGQPVPAEGGVE